jgi:hypothetical protein
MLTANNFKATSDFLPSTVKNAIGQPPICDVIRVAGQEQVIRFVEFELIRMTQLVSVGNNLNNAQVEFIATQLVEMFPNESLADFKICFQRGCIGQYGDIFRMDGIVLRKWMEKYLEEKYTIIDEQWQKEKSGEYHQPIQPAEDGPGRRLFDEYANSLKIGAKIPDLPEDEIKRTGQAEPPKKKAISYHYSPEQISVMVDRKTEYGRLHTDTLTGKTLPGHPTFEEFNKLYDLM